jgi:hypothetical protein
MFNQRRHFVDDGVNSPCSKANPSDLTINVLLDSNKSLRLVHLMKLAKSQLGPINTIADCDIQTLEMLKQNSVFSVGPERIVEILSHVDPNYKLNLIKAVVDRPSELSIRTGLRKSTGAEVRFSVASGRQAYVLLADGSFLGIKGSGQYILPEQEPYILHHDGLSGKRKWFGFVGRHEISNLIKYKRIIKEAGEYFCFSQVLAYRKVNSLLNQDLMLESVNNLPTDDLNRTASPHLIFYKTLSPLRLNKLPQILSRDPELQTTLYALSTPARRALGLAEFGDIKITDWLHCLARQMGAAESFKSAHNVHKDTLHLQDINFVGQENDLEELVVSSEFPMHQVRAYKVKMQMLIDVYDCLVQHNLEKKIGRFKTYSEEFERAFLA